MTDSACEARRRNFLTNSASNRTFSSQADAGRQLVARLFPAMSAHIKTALNDNGLSMPKLKDVKKVVLAYSGGLDTSIILKWLQTELGAEVVTFTADLGQGGELEPARKKAELLGIRDIRVMDVREEFVRDFVFPMFRANALYEGTYLLGTSIARPLISKHLVEIARETGADAIAHGATGKGNDQVRFELSAYALNPDIKVIAPWRDWSFKSRTDLLDFAEKHQIPVPKDKQGEAPFSVDANLLHSSSEGKVLEDPWSEPPEYVHQRSVSPMDAPDAVTEIEIEFLKGDPITLNGKKLSPAEMLTALNDLGRDNGIGRIDLVENRFVGMKSRGVYETPGGTILIAAHRAIESITLDRGAAHLKDELMPRYAELITQLVFRRNGFALGEIPAQDRGPQHPVKLPVELLARIGVELQARQAEIRAPRFEPRLDDRRVGPIRAGHGPSTSLRHSP